MKGSEGKTRTRSAQAAVFDGGEGEWTQVFAIASRAELADGSHPLSAAFARANDVLRIAG